MNSTGQEDSSSRCFVSTGCYRIAWNTISPFKLDWEELNEEIMRDPELSNIQQGLLNGEKVLQWYSLDDQHLIYQGRLVASVDSQVICQIPWEWSRWSFWSTKNLSTNGDQIALDWNEKDVEKLVEECLAWQRQKYSTTTPAGLLQPLSCPNKFGQPCPWIS